MSASSLIVVGAVSALKPLPTMLRELVDRTGGGFTVLHVEDAVADLLRKQPIDAVDLDGLVDGAARLAPERVWAPAADEAIKASLEHRRPKSHAVVVYRHHEYDPVVLFPRLRMSAKVAGVPIIDGRNGKLIRRDPTDHLRVVEERIHPHLRAAIDASVPKKETAAWPEATLEP